jgi:hypothetical protein
MTFPFPIFSPRAELSLEKTDVTFSTANDPEYTFSNRAIGLADPDRYIAVAVSLRDDSANGQITALTIGGISASKAIGNQQSASSLSIHSSIWIAAVPTGTTATIVATCSSTSTDCAITVYRLTGIAGTAPSDTDSSIAEGTDPLAAMDLDIPTGGGIAIGCGAQNFGAGASWSGLVEDDDALNGSLLHTAASELLTAAETARAIEVTLVQDSHRSAVCAVWASA